jgi:hypothetical protein
MFGRTGMATLAVDSRGRLASADDVPPTRSNGIQSRQCIQGWRWQPKAWSSTDIRGSERRHSLALYHGAVILERRSISPQGFQWGEHRNVQFRFSAFNFLNDRLQMVSSSM